MKAESARMIAQMTLTTKVNYEIEKGRRICKDKCQDMCAGDSGEEICAGHFRHVF